MAKRPKSVTLRCIYQTFISQAFQKVIFIGLSPPFLLGLDLATGSLAVEVEPVAIDRATAANGATAGNGTRAVVRAERGRKKRKETGIRRGLKTSLRRRGK